MGYELQGMTNEAEQHYRRELALREELLDTPGAVSPSLALQSLGRVYDEQGRFGEAEQMWLRLVEIARQDNMCLDTALLRLGRHYELAGNLEEAERTFADALAAGAVDCSREQFVVRSSGTLADVIRT